MVTTDQQMQLSATARRAISQKDWATASACAAEVLKNDSSSAEGHFLSGIVSMAAQQPTIAARAFSKALELGEESLLLFRIAERPMSLPEVEERHVVLGIQRGGLFEMGQRGAGASLGDEHPPQPDKALLELGVVLRHQRFSALALPLEIVGEVDVADQVAFVQGRGAHLLVDNRPNFRPWR